MTTYARACRALVAAAGAAMVVLVLTGAWLTRWYRPVHAAFGGGDSVPGVRAAIALHRVGAGVLLLAGGLLLGLRLGSAARRATAAPAALLVAAGVGLVSSGRRLAWTVLGLRAVTVNLDAAGMLFAAFHSRFIVVPGHGEVRPAVFRAVLGVHAVVLPLLVAGLLWLDRRRQPGLDSPTAPGT